MSLKIFKFKSFPALFGLLFVLTGCYFPASFDAEIEISRNGFYKMSFDGYIVELSLYDRIRKKNITPEEKEKKIQQVISDFKRDSSTKEISHFRQGAFKITWVKSGDAIKSPQIVFFRRTRTANMLSISFDKKTLEFTVRGASIGSRDAKKLEAMGLTMQGVLRVKTDGRVISHNANRVTKQGPITLYGWRIKSVFDKAPKLVVAIR